MTPFFTIIKLDYLQRTRSYVFLITLCASLAIAYTFVPEPNAGYSTIQIAGHVGYYNAAWFGYVTAIMTSVFLSLIGFYLVNSGIKKDIETKVGQIVSATSISNFKYLMSKVLSNFLLLLTIVLIVFMMSIVLFLIYNEGFSFELFQFVKPYVLITIPAMFFIATLAVVFEVFFGKYSVIQNVSFFFSFIALMVFSPKKETAYALDVLGTKIVMHDLEQSVKVLTNTDEATDVSIGYVTSNLDNTKKFLFNGFDFPSSFILSRLIWIVLCIASIALIVPLFHRFNLKERMTKIKFSKIEAKPIATNEVLLSKIPVPKISYSSIPLIKTEFLLLLRKGKKWVWLLNITGMVLLAVLPLKMAHQMVLPILWFLQVSRISNVTTKEATHHMHYFAFSSFKPINRLLVSQLFAAIMMMIVLAAPLILRLGLAQHFSEATMILLGGTFIVLLASFLGMLSKGKKLFEVLFFMVTYATINGIPFVDYFGAYSHKAFYLQQMTLFVGVLLVASILIRNYQLKNAM